VGAPVRSAGLHWHRHARSALACLHRHSSVARVTCADRIKERVRRDTGSSQLATAAAQVRQRDQQVQGRYCTYCRNFEVGLCSLCCVFWPWRKLCQIPEWLLIGNGLLFAYRSTHDRLASRSLAAPVADLSNQTPAAACTGEQSRA